MTKQTQLFVFIYIFTYVCVYNNIQRKRGYQFESGGDMNRVGGRELGRNLRKERGEIM